MMIFPPGGISIKAEYVEAVVPALDFMLPTDGFAHPHVLSPKPWRMTINKMAAAYPLFNLEVQKPGALNLSGHTGKMIK